MELERKHWIVVKMSSKSSGLDHNKLWKILKKMGIYQAPEKPYLPPEKPYAGQEITVRTQHGTMDWFKTGKEILESYILSPCLFIIIFAE